tara:strand:- start:100 stop:522 length:423 start_codon:yes stop_codon:yes gene_type:complete
MKISTVLEKIKALDYSDMPEQTQEAMQSLLIDLTEAYNLAVAKERSSLIKKFSKHFDIHAEEIEKHILPKNKRQEAKERLQEYERIQENQAIKWEGIVYNDKEYYRQPGKYGIVITNNNGKLQLVGHMGDDGIVFRDGIF